MKDWSGEKTRAAIYGLGGVYLIYLAYNIVKNLSENAGGAYLFAAFCAVLFVAAGIGMIGFFVWSMYKGSQKTGEEEHTEEE